MKMIDCIVALVLLLLFLPTGTSCLVYIFTISAKTQTLINEASAISFVANSFRKTCRSLPNEFTAALYRDIILTNWKNTVETLYPKSEFEIISDLEDKDGRIQGITLVAKIVTSESILAERRIYEKLCSD